MPPVSLNAPRRDEERVERMRLREIDDLAAQHEGGKGRTAFPRKRSQLESAAVHGACLS
ncbi:MAG TPA: hypothetical protein VJ376_08745 [Pseudomonadota bacterium]|nr:hypothetical protein [Pseudomonadota bacterium]